MTQSAQSPHIALIGLMGTGKSTVGRRLAKRVGYGFFDTDDELQLSSARSVRDIFANDGEEVFRDLEAQTLSDAYARVDPLVIAVAGGGVLRQSNRLLISQMTHRIWLTADVDLVTRRVSARALSKQGHRPLIDDDPRARLMQLYSERSSVYASLATSTVDVTDLKINEVVDVLTTIVTMEVAP